MKYFMLFRNIINRDIVQSSQKIKIHCERTYIRTMKYLTQDEAIKVDTELFNDYKFSVDQLMELAGLSCAAAIADCYPAQCLKDKRVLVCCGPGNNGGDGLVIARHLSITGYFPHVYYPVMTNKDLYRNLTHQCLGSGVPFVKSCPDIKDINDFGLIVDALFGFSFKPPVRDNFKDIMAVLEQTTTPIVSIDIPSGWDVESGCPEEGGIKPSMLVSLTAPKKCAMTFKGTHHYLGGLFVPPALQMKYSMELPTYPGTCCYIKL